MVIWITLLAIVVIALVLGLVRLRSRPRAAEHPPAPPLRSAPPTPGEYGATIRSYIVPKRWLSSKPDQDRASDETVEHPQYARATVERVSEGGSRSGTWDLLRGRTRLGRDSDNHVVLDDERVSLHHALITVREGVYWLEDLGSTNGTFVGEEKRVMAAHPLVDGEEIRLGGVVLVFRGTPG
jgi:hypothetical protein